MEVSYVNQKKITFVDYGKLGVADESDPLQHWDRSDDERERSKSRIPEAIPVFWVYVCTSVVNYLRHDTWWWEQSKVGFGRGTWRWSQRGQKPVPAAILNEGMQS